ncbi:hypothetical protein V8C44DRAFT_254751 [Trichoderma aethiopicum]
MRGEHQLWEGPTLGNDLRYYFLSPRISTASITSQTCILHWLEEKANRTTPSSPSGKYWPIPGCPIDRLHARDRQFDDAGPSLRSRLSLFGPVEEALQAEGRRAKRTTARKRQTRVHCRGNCVLVWISMLDTCPYGRAHPYGVQSNMRASSSSPSAASIAVQKMSWQFGKWPI